MCDAQMCDTQAAHRPVGETMRDVLIGNKSARIHTRDSIQSISTRKMYGDEKEKRDLAVCFTRNVIARRATGT